MTDPVKTESPRLYVDLKAKTFPVIFSYRDLLKHRNREQSRAVALLPNNDEDEYYKNLLARAAQYDTHDGEDVEENDSEDDNAGVDKTKRAQEDYDYDDPFIDDSEMLIDEPQSVPLPEYDGFFVYYGQLDGNDLPGAKRSDKSKTGVTKRKTAQTKPKEKAAATSKEKPTPKKQPSTQLPKASDAIVPSSGELKEKPSPSISKERETGTKKVSTSNAGDATDSATKKKTKPSTTSSTTALSSTPKKTAAHTTVAKAADGDKKKAKPAGASNELQPLSPKIEALVERLKQLAQNESFENKAKFPPNLRPTTLEIGLAMFREYNCLDNNVISHLMPILHYNRFTLNKFITTKAGPDRVKELHAENQSLITQLKAVVDANFPEQFQQYNEKVAAAASTQSSLHEAQDGSHAGGGTEDPVAQPPKFKFNDEGKMLLYKILKNDHAATALSNEIHKYSNKEDEIVTETKARKQIYLKLLACFPEGWMTTIEMSRQHSQFKAKIDKQNRPSHGDASGAKPVKPAATTVKKYTPLKEQKRTTEVTPQKRERDVSVEGGIPKRQMIVLDSPPRADQNTASLLNPSEQPSALPWDRPESMMIKSLISDNKSG